MLLKRNRKLFLALAASVMAIGCSSSSHHEEGDAPETPSKESAQIRSLKGSPSWECAPDD